MKKQFFLLILTIISTLTLFGCSKKQDITLDVDALSNELIEKVKFDDELLKLSNSKSKNLYSLDENDITNVIIYVSTSAKADELALIEAKDDDTAEELLKKVNERITLQKESFENYAPTEVSKIDDALLISKGKYIVLCISNDHDNAKKIINEYMD